MQVKIASIWLHCCIHVYEIHVVLSLYQNLICSRHFLFCDLYISVYMQGVVVVLFFWGGGILVLLYFGKWWNGICFYLEVVLVIGAVSYLTHQSRSCYLFLIISHCLSIIAFNGISWMDVLHIHVYAFKDK